MTQNAAALQQLYLAYFNRPAEPDGLQYWSEAMLQGMTLADIGQQFATSPEYQANYSGVSNQEVVNRVYHHLFGRAPEAEGAHFWAAKLDNAELSVNNVVAAVTNGAAGADLTTIQIKQSLASWFTDAYAVSRSYYDFQSVDLFASAKTALSTVHDVASANTFAATIREIVTQLPHLAGAGNASASSAVTMVNVQSAAGITLVASSNLGALTTVAATAPLVVNGSPTANNHVDISAATQAVIYHGGAGVDTITVGGGANLIITGGGHDVLNIKAAGTDLQTFTTLLDPHPGVEIHFAALGTPGFQGQALQLSASASLQDYANACVQQGGNASHDGQFAWFQFHGDTYLVEGRHDAASVPQFVAGTDFMLKLAGLVDLSQAYSVTTLGLTLS